ncbi:MAG: GxxExxY protein [Pirellulales bacterium]
MGESFEPVSQEVDAIAKSVIDAALHVHRALGPGLLESAYEICLCHELSKRRIKVERQKSWPILYDGIRLDAGLRLDLLVEDQVIVELKAVEQMNPLFEAQLLTYLKLAGRRLGLLINFNVPLLKDGIKRLVR